MVWPKVSALVKSLVQRLNGQLVAGRPGLLGSYLLARGGGAKKVHHAGYCELGWHKHRNSPLSWPKKWVLKFSACDELEPAFLS